MRLRPIDLYDPDRFEPGATVPAVNTEITDVWFHRVVGGNLNLDAAEKVVAVIDGRLVFELYLPMCAAQGIPRAPVLVEPRSTLTQSAQPVARA